MPVTVSIPTIMRTLTGGEKRVQATGATLAEVIGDLEANHPGFAGRLLSDGKLNRYVNIYVDDDDVRFIGGLAAEVPAGGSVTVLPAVAGGAVEEPRKANMQIAILLYDRFTALDAIGPYEVLSRMPDAETVFVAEQAGPVRNDMGSLALTADRTLGDVVRPDIVLVPGGPGQTAQMTNTTVHDWLRAVDATSTYTTSVCTGSLLLAELGFLTGRRATSHWLGLEELRRRGAEPTSQRVVVDGKYVTAAGVSAGIDMALTLAGMIAGDRHAQAIQLLTEYDPHPPYDAGSPAKAPQELVQEMRAASRHPN
ncbi:DJ-1/PfpI family protein [Nocardia sp. BSTN01]|uniref:DJ-1/PfpI family protein n=1 Tax=Nocardia sp. BSTN01 TaxID=2783665 RepID=UPI0018906A05|nr:DJ-1/PfpI family protein [Nocardia sp. BSTN01]MBF4996648.1 DJ-1/PfpI family protein [Nocardia sp. BSTN01]